MPSSFITVPPGADMPKRSMPTTAPSRPTYFAHVELTVASMATRLRRLGQHLFAVGVRLLIETREARDADGARTSAELLGGLERVLQLATGRAQDQL
jgi:hypothetical protein